MDEYLLNYITSGKAWVLIGSGPSIEMGYPSWERLASISINTVKTEQMGADLSKLTQASKDNDYPKVFQEAKQLLGEPRLLQVLRENMKPTKRGVIYNMLAQWPIQVYMTTNYDDELQDSLARLSLAYIPYLNSNDHMSLLLPDFSGAIVKLHGDLRSGNGLILTDEDYTAITESSAWEYWRSKMAAVFQMNRVIIIGHSLSDRNIKHVLQAAKSGAGVSQPVVWIAPDVSLKDRKEFLEKYRIRVVSYDNKDGQHKNLVKLIDSLKDFIPLRTIIRVREQVEKPSKVTVPHDAAAGFFVFNEVHKNKDFEKRRVDIVVSAIQAVVPELNKIGAFSINEALETSGWPPKIKVDTAFAAQIVGRAVENDILQPVDDKLQVTAKALQLHSTERKAFEHIRERFKKSLILRTKRDFPDLKEAQASLIAEDIDASLTEYFREIGLSLASVLFSKESQKTMPISMLPAIITATTRYDDFTMRQAFFKVSVDSFVRPESADIEYLGRISQGFFAFHGLGVFGDVAEERLRIAKETVWLVDSDTQIHALALGASTNFAYKECLSRLREIGLRIFTTSSLLEETREHLWFANHVITENGPRSPYVFAAARGEVPYRKSNLFLEGFIKWQDAGNPCNWGSYLYKIFEETDYSKIDMNKALSLVGIEVVDLAAWPGFVDLNYVEIEDYTKGIAKIWDNTQEQRLTVDSELPFDAYKKAKPEAEAYNIVKREREGDYYIISEKGHKNSAWFISYTSILNMLERGNYITWQPQAFLSFASTLCNSTDIDLAKQSFNRLLLGLAQSGLNLLDNDTIARVFGSVIDQAKISIEELRHDYQETLEKKYGEPIESIIARVNPSQLPMATIQLAAEIAQNAVKRSHIAEIQADKATRHANELEVELRKVQKYKAKLLKKQSTPKKQRKKKKHK